MVQENNLKKAIIICGPTASGKTDLAVECAKLLNSEVVSADSLYVYKKLDIGTAKPSQQEMQGIKHHMIDIIDPTEEFSVSEYKNLAQPILERLFSLNKIPIICGGTGFYINSLLYNFSYGKGSANLDVRNYYKDLAEKFGNLHVYNILKQKDLETANKLHYNDQKRVIRALEILENGIKKSDINDELIPNFNYLAYSINHDRETLYNRINTRVDKMFEMGLLKEVDELLSLGVDFTHQSMQGIGYKELQDYYNGVLSLDQTKELIKLNTRHYAKRQITFFKRMENIKFLTPEHTTEMAKNIVKEVKEL